MKLSVIAMALFVLAASQPAMAYGDHANFDCGNGIEAAAWKTNVTVTLPQDRQDEDFTLRSSSGKIFVNGKRCMVLNDGAYLKRECAKGGDDHAWACAEIRERWPDMPRTKTKK